jgi:MFS transporter, UMF1 family
MTTDSTPSTPIKPDNPREITGWAMYDWANSAFSTTVAVVFLGPYVAGLARSVARAAGTETVSLLGLPIAPDSFLPYCISLSVGLQVLFLPILGAIADYSHLRKQMMQLFATIGAVTTMAMFFVAGSLWWLGGALFIIANLAFGAAMVFYNAYLPDIATEERRDRVSSLGWGLGYLGGGLLLLLNLAFYRMHSQLGVGDGMAVRINLASAGLWWFGWSFYTWTRVRPRHAARPRPHGISYLRIGFSQLRRTVAEAHRYPHTIRYLVAYLVYNDGIQTVIGIASIFAAAPLIRGGLAIPQSTLILVILMIQFVAFGGALYWGRLAGRVGAKRAIIISLCIWSGVVIWANLGLRGESRISEFWMLAASIAVVLGGSQAISRSLFAQMIPPGKEAEFFSIYEISERGTSWIGPLLFGLVNQLTGSLRLAILALIVFFVGGLLLLWLRVDVPRAIRESGRREANG